MCNVCVADAALATARCGKKDCVAFEEGHQITWPNGPRTKAPTSRAKWKGRVFAHSSRSVERATVFVRARGRDAEGRADFQLRRPHAPWPTTWQTTDSLASAVAMYGLDIRWGKHVPKPVQQWVTGQTAEMPTLDVLYELREQQRARRRCVAPPRRLRVRRSAPKTTSATPRKRG